MIYLPDTDTLNYIIKKIEPAYSRFYRELAAGATFVLSSYAHFQVTRYFKLKGATRLHRDYDALIAGWERIELVDADWDDAADLWAAQHRLGQPIDDADLLIALCAKKAGAVVVTNNLRHFSGLGVPLENWTV